MFQNLTSLHYLNVLGFFLAKTILVPVNCVSLWGPGMYHLPGKTVLMFNVNRRL